MRMVKSREALTPEQRAWFERAIKSEQDRAALKASYELMANVIDDPEHSEWQPMTTAPKDATWVIVMTNYRGEVRAHWASGDGDGLMPPFEGWFVKSGGGYSAIPQPIAWKHEPTIQKND
jgi:hypothetical protein